MSNLAVSNSEVLDIDKFDINNFFYTDSFLFKRLTLGEKAFAIFENIFATLFLILFLYTYLKLTQLRLTKVCLSTIGILSYILSQDSLY